MVKVRAFRTLENALRRMGFVYVAGVDEAIDAAGFKACGLEAQ